jgi:hypothetical protein
MLVAFILGGCVNLTKYERASVLGPKARVRVVTGMTSTRVYNVQNNDCRQLIGYGLLKKGYSDGSLPENSLGMPWIRERKGEVDNYQYMEVYMSTEKPQDIYVAAKNNFGKATYNFRVTFEEGKDYEIHFVFPYVSVYEISAGGSDFWKIDVEKTETSCIY